jgi:hypothetical protein
VRDDEVLDALNADILTALGTPESLGVGRILPSVGGEDFLANDLEGQLPAVGIADVDMSRAENLGITRKRFKGKVGYEISVAAAAEGEGTVAGRAEVRKVLGLINKVLDFRQNPFHFPFVFIDFATVRHPRQSAVILVARFETFAYFGNE